MLTNSANELKDEDELVYITADFHSTLNSSRLFFYNKTISEAINFQAMTAIFQSNAAVSTVLQHLVLK